MENNRTGYLTIFGAAAVLGVSRVHIWRLVRRHNLPIYRSDADARLRLLRASDVLALGEPRLATSDHPTES